MTYVKSQPQGDQESRTDQRRSVSAPFVDSRGSTAVQLNNQRQMQTANPGGIEVITRTPSVPAQLVASMQPSAQLPIQMAKLNIRPKDGTISGVSSWPSRPSSNLSGTQGQHLTAYVVFQDTILSKVKDQTPDGAARALKDYLDEILTLPGMQQKNVAYLKEAIDEVRTSLDDSDNVGSAIDTILSIRNKVPGTAQRGSGGGHDESGSSGRLEVVESALRNKTWNDSWDEDIVSDQCRYMVWRLLDYNPAEPVNEDGANAIIKVIVTHYKSIISAYPHVNQWLVKRDDFFQTYLEAHRDDAGMPLKQIKPKTLSAIFTEVLKSF